MSPKERHVPAATERVTDPAERFVEHRRRLAQVEFGNPFPTFRAYMTSPLTVTTGTSEGIPFDVWENGDPRVFTPFLTNGTFEVLELNMPGLYVGMIHIDWENWEGSPRAVGLYDTWADTFEVGDRVSDDGASGPGPGGAYPLTFCKQAPSVWGQANDPVPAPGDTQALWFVQVYQNSGVDRDVNVAAWEIHYLGGISLPSRTTVP